MPQLPDWIPFAFGLSLIALSLLVFAGVVIFLAMDEDNIRSKARR